MRILIFLCLKIICIKRRSNDRDYDEREDETYCVYPTAIDNSSLCYCRDNIPGVCSKDAVFRPFNNV